MATEGIEFSHAGGSFVCRSRATNPPGADGFRRHTTHHEVHMTPTFFAVTTGGGSG